MNSRSDKRRSLAAVIVDRNDSEPAYAQLVKILQEQISYGHYRPGDKLPAESKLCHLHNVSPMTVRRAINILVDQGLVRTSQGLGTFVKPIEMGSATFSLEELQRLFSSRHTSVKILAAKIVSASNEVAEELSVQSGARIIQIERIISNASQPIFYHSEYIIFDPRRPFVEAELEVTTINGLFNGSGGGCLKRGSFILEAVILKDEEARHLGAVPGSAGFRLIHHFFDFDDKPVSWGWFLSASERLRFSAEVGSPK